MNALTYVAGYLLGKVLAKPKCTVCQQELSSNKLDNSNKLLCFFKAYEVSKENPFGGLVMPSDSFIDYVKNIEALFVTLLTNNVNRLGIGQYLLSALPKFVLPQCQGFPSTFLLKLFVRMRIHFALKFYNRELYSNKKKNRKLFKVSHL